MRTRGDRNPSDHCALGARRLRGRRRRGACDETKPALLRIALAAASVGCALLTLSPDPAGAVTLGVNATGDGSDAAPGNGACATAGGQCTLRAAIEEANALGGQDTLAVPAGTYVLASGDLMVASDLIVDGAAASSTIVRPQLSGRIFHVAASGKLDLRDVTVRDGALAADGGGIRSLGSLIVRRSVIAHNQAMDSRGGGILAGGPTEIIRSTIGTSESAQGNRAKRGGGLFRLSGAGPLTIRDSVVGGNTVERPEGAGGNPSGGGISAEGSQPVTVERSAIVGNAALTDETGVLTFGGGIESGGPLVVRDSRVARNRIAEPGVDAGVLSFGATTIVRSAIEGNEGGAGIGHQPTGEKLSVRDSLISANTENGIETRGPTVLENVTISGNGFWGILVEETSLTASHVTFTGNEASGPADIALFDGAVTLRATILDANGTPSCGFVFGGAGSFTSQGRNVERGSSCNLTRPSDRTGVNPRLRRLADNGGPTQTHMLHPKSPAVDIGARALASDQRGVPRPRRRGDAGAAELARCAGAIVNRVGTGGRDVLRGTRGRDGILGLGGADRIRALGGRDGVCAGPGNDRVSGGGGSRDVVRGQGGRDRLKGGGGRGDLCHGGGGRDRANRSCERTRRVP